MRFAQQEGGAGCRSKYFFFYFFLTNKVRESKTTAAAVATARKSKLADGCYHVLLGVGANIGVNVRFLYEPHLYPKAHKVWKLFDDEFGSSRDNGDQCVFAFQPNPAHGQRFENLTTAYTKMGWRYQHFMAGVSDIDGRWIFIICTIKIRTTGASPSFQGNLVPRC